MDPIKPELSMRMVGAFATLWLGWSVAFALAQTSIDAVLRSQVPRLGYMALLFAAALATLFIGGRLWHGWRGGLGLISITFAIFAGGVGLWRHWRLADISPLNPGSSLLALALSVTGSIVVGFVLLNAERSKFLSGPPVAPGRRPEDGIDQEKDMIRRRT